MSPLEENTTEKPVGQSAEEVSAPRAADWLWKPWYAKAWWVAIPIYWLPAGSPFKIDFLVGFYSSSTAFYLNILFLPVTTLVVLGLGYARRLRELGHWNDEYILQQNRASALHRRRPYGPPAYADPLSPLSGSKWIGSSKSRARREGR